MIARFTLLTSTLMTLLATPSAAATSSGWEYLSTYGEVHVSADMTHITVCDTSADNEYVEAEYATSILGIHTVADSNGAAPGCGSDRTFISTIDVFKMCTGIRGVSRTCRQPVWIGGR